MKMDADISLDSFWPIVCMHLQSDGTLIPRLNCHINSITLCLQAAGLKPVVDYTKKKVAEVHLEELKTSLAEMLAAEPPFPVPDLISAAKAKKLEWQLLDADIVKVHLPICQGTSRLHPLLSDLQPPTDI